MGAATLTNTNVYSNDVYVGGGVYVYLGGEATLTNSNVYQNEANYVRSLLNRLPAPRWNVTRVHAWLWQGGGVYVHSGGKATLTNSNVYQNEAKYVRSCFLNRHPSPR